MATFIGLGITSTRTDVLGTPLDQALIGGSDEFVMASQSHNDLSLDAAGNLRMVVDAEAVGEHARQRLLFYKGEWRFDPSIGVDWFGQVHGFAESRAPVAEAIVKREILQTPGVTGLRDVSTSYDRTTRGLHFERAVVETQFDEDAVVA